VLTWPRFSVRRMTENIRLGDWAIRQTWGGIRPRIPNWAEAKHELTEDKFVLCQNTWLPEPGAYNRESSPLRNEAKHGQNLGQQAEQEYDHPGGFEIEERLLFNLISNSMNLSPFYRMIRGPGRRRHI
jgi:hypothetical protein